MTIAPTAECAGRTASSFGIGRAKAVSAASMVPGAIPIAVPGDRANQFIGGEFRPRDKTEQRSEAPCCGLAEEMQSRDRRLQSTSKHREAVHDFQVSR